jgi:hypothetical protein
MNKDLQLTTEGTSNKEVYLPNNAKLRTSQQTKLPFDNLTNATREADISPGLKRSLITNPFKDSSNLKTPNFNFVKQITVDLT